MSTEVHTLSGAYALDALSVEEAVEFRRHLAECEACREEVRELQQAAARMGAAQASAPSAALRTRVLAAADRTPQLPPPDIARPRRTRWARPFVAAAAAVVIAGAGVAGYQALDDGPGTSQGTTLNAAASAVFAATDARTATVATSNGGSLTVGVSAVRDEMAVDTRDLPPLDDEHVYQIWSIQGDRTVSAAVLRDTSQGAAMPMPGEASEVAITVEPSPGSETPTTQPIVQVDPYTV